MIILWKKQAIEGGGILENNRQEEIRKKGFKMDESVVNYGKIKVGIKTLDDATLNLGALKSGNRNLANKPLIMKALAEQDIELLREISNYFYRTNGIYQRACNYFATMYRYDWYVVPEIYDTKTAPEKIIGDFAKVLNYLDNSYVKKVCGDIALEVIKSGAYYGYIIESKNGLMLQQLPINYCRSRYNIGNMPAVEFNMRFFDDKFPDVNYRMKVLKMFPHEFAKGYVLYKQGKLKSDDNTLDLFATGWYLLEPGSVIKFNFNNGDIPLFVNSCPAILDLDAAQDLDRRKQMQKLLKIIVQKLPLDKNGDLIFDVDEARDIHNNAVQMLRRAIGLDVLTTFTDVEAINVSDNNTATTTDDLEKVERSVYNSFGVSKDLFNTDGNLSLEKSILNDEGSIRSLLLQFAIFFDTITQKQNKAKRSKYNFRLYMLETTQYNYKELSKLYKEQTQIGYSKMLPQIALGHSQSAILNTAHFENEVLHLSEIMIPPLMSSTMNLADLKDKTAQDSTQKIQNNTETQKAGRPEKADDEKSDKTIANKESMG